MKKLTKAERIKQYNQANPDYNITGIKQVNKQHLQWLRVNGAKTLGELYKSCSFAKKASYNDIINTYNPIEIIGLQGSSMAYSVTLIANNGDTLWITKDNNYLVKEVM